MQTMNNLFALDSAGQEAQAQQRRVIQANAIRAAVEVERYSAALEQQLAALKQLFSTLQNQNTEEQPGDGCVASTYPAWPRFAEVERYLAVLEETIAQRKPLEHQLRFYASLQENVSDAVITTDLSFRIQSWNRAAEIIYGWCAEEVIGKSVQEVLQTHYPSADLHAQMHQTFWQQGWWQGEIVQHRQDGARLYILGSVTLLRDEQGQPLGIVAINHDITERKRAEESLRESEEKFRRFVDVAPVAIIVTDHQGRIVLVNRQTELLFDYQRHELIDQPLELLVPEGKRPQHQDHRMAYLAAPHVREMGSGLELFARRRDGVAIPVEIQLSYLETAAGLLVMSFVLDITERKRAAAALREQRDFLQLVIDSVPTLITVKDREHRFQLVNRAFAQRHGVTPAALSGKTEAEFVRDKTELHEVYQRTESLLATGQPLLIPTEKVFERYYQSAFIPLKNGSGTYDRLLVVASDITTHRQAEVALERMLKKERELNELRARVVTTASHELRTPLASILALTETLLAYRPKLTDAQINQRLVGIREQVEFLRMIINNMLQVEGLQRGHSDLQRSPVDLDVLCRGIIAELQTQPGFCHHLHYQRTEPVPVLALDKRLIRQVIQTLVENALKYSPPTSTVQVSLTCRETTIGLVIQDEGIGIPPADFAHLFQPFQRGSNVGTTAGVGLGLVIAKEAVELHGGTITVTSEVGKGTTFTVSIPLIGEGVASDESFLGHQPTLLSCCR